MWCCFRAVNGEWRMENGVAPFPFTIPYSLFPAREAR
jgi:hypothetical protein